MPTELEEIRGILEQHEKRISDLENLAAVKPKKMQKKLSVKEFILEKKPGSDVEKTLVVAYYLENCKNVSPFNLNDLEALFKKAKEIVPDNLNDKVNKNIAKGYMEEAEDKKDSKKAWTLTETGERFVENDLKKED